MSWIATSSRIDIYRSRMKKSKIKHVSDGDWLSRIATILFIFILPARHSLTKRGVHSTMKPLQLCRHRLRNITDNLKIYQKMIIVTSTVRNDIDLHFGSHRFIDRWCQTCREIRLQWANVLSFNSSFLSYLNIFENIDLCQWLQNYIRIYI